MVDGEGLADAGTEVIAAFPLGTVLLPGQNLDLRVFEPRYRVMLFDLRDQDPAELLVNMIERGSEVGGGDVRSRVGCIARLEQRTDLPDGTTVISIIGSDRARVVEWLAEDPYPTAEVTRLIEPSGFAPHASVGSTAALAELRELGESVLDAAESLGQPREARPHRWETDPVHLSWQLALATPLATLDRYRLLAEDDPRRRIELLSIMLAEALELLSARKDLQGPWTDFT
jgi:Lon protease-like protein